MVETEHPSDIWASGEALLDDGKRPIQFAPHGGIVPIRRTSDTFDQSTTYQLYKPLISENQVDNDDIKNYYNPNPSWTHSDYGAAEV